jgi:hypothetical protein
MRRWIGRSATVLCLAGLLATAVLWVHAYWHLDALVYVHPDGRTTAVMAGPHQMALIYGGDTLRLYVNAVGGGEGVNVYSVGFGQTITLDLSRIQLPSSPGVTFSGLSGTMTLNVPRPTGGLSGWWGFSFDRQSAAQTGVIETTLTAPFWFLTLLWAIWPAVVLVRWGRKRRRFAAGRCQVCGYDLRATPERCPECGTVAC